MQFANDVNHRPLSRVPGIDNTVHAIDVQAGDPGLVFFIVGMFL